MTERLVQIPLEKETRNLIKQTKRELSYNEFFKKVMDGKFIVAKEWEN